MYFVRLYKKQVMNKILINRLLEKNLIHQLNVFKEFKKNYLMFNRKNFKAYRQALQIKFNFYKTNYPFLLLILYKLIYRRSLLESLFGNYQKMQYLIGYTLEFIAMRKKKGVLFLTKSAKGQIIKFFIVKGNFNNKQNQFSILLSLVKMILMLPLLTKRSTTTFYFKYFTYNTSKFILSFFKKVFIIKTTINCSNKPYNGCRPKKEKRRKLK